MIIYYYSHIVNQTKQNIFACEHYKYTLKKSFLMLDGGKLQLPLAA